MKLLFLAERFAPEIGGVAVSASRIARALARIGHEVDVVVFTRQLPAGGLVSEQVAERLTVHRFGEAKNLDFTLQLLLTFLDWLHRQQNFAWVWGHYLTTAGFVAAWFGKRQGVRSILAIRGNDLDRQLFPPGDFARLQWCLQQATALVAVSADLARSVQALVDREAIVLPNAVDTEVFSPGPADAELRQRFAFSPEELVLAFVGELRAKKGLPFLIETFQRVLARQPARLLVIGELRAQDRGLWERLVSGQRELADRTIFTGHLPESQQVAAHLRLADVFLLPSLWEGMPNSLLEAMATGIPVIASDAGGIPEVVDDGLTGFLVPRTHLHTMADRIEEWFSLPANTRTKMISAARDVVCRCYSFASEEQRLRELFERLESSSS